MFLRSLNDLYKAIFLLIVIAENLFGRKKEINFGINKCCFFMLSYKSFFDYVISWSICVTFCKTI